MKVFNLTKSCLYSPVSSIHLDVNFSSVRLEIRSNGSIIARMDFPVSESGISYAKRVFNGLQ